MISQQISPIDTRIIIIIQLMSDPEHPLPLPQPKSSQVELTHEQLCDEVCSYYLQLRSDQLPSLSSQIPNDFANIQRQIIDIVQLRKNMERVIEVETLQSQHFPTVQSLVGIIQKQEKTIAEMSNHIKELQNRNMNAFLQSLQKHRNSNTAAESGIIEKGHQLILELRDFKRTFTMQPNHLSSVLQECSPFDEGSQMQEWQHQQHFEQLIHSQKRRWDLAKFIYSIRFKELNLRDELIEERERAHQDFQRTNNELIDTLLREKERDKNLRKKDNEKFGEIIKQRDQIDLQNENLSHSQKSLLPHLQNELLKMKSRLRQQESKHELDHQKWQKKQDELTRQLQQVTAQTKALETSFMEKQLMFRDKINEMKLALEVNAQNRKTTEGSLKASRAEAEIQLQRVKSKCKHLQHENSQLIAKNQHLQSQYNELILKSSQLNHIKSDLAQKFDKAAKKAQQLQTKQEELKVNLIAKDEELRNLQASLSALKSEKEHFQTVITSLESELSAHKQYVKHYEEKTSLLESQLTQNFILHNSERGNLLIDLEEKDKTIKLQAIQIAQLLKNKSNDDLSQQPLNVSSTLLQDLRQELLQQLSRSSKAKFELIDSFIGRMDNIV